jgi:hypothetical protein
MLSMEQEDVLWAKGAEEEIDARFKEVSNDLVEILRHFLGDRLKRADEQGEEHFNREMIAQAAVLEAQSAFYTTELLNEDQEWGEYAQDLADCAGVVEEPPFPQPRASA